LICAKISRVISCAGPIASQQVFLPSWQQISPIDNFGLGHGTFCLNAETFLSLKRGRLVLNVELEFMNEDVHHALYKE
jgi:hypothetical protein